LNRINNNFPIIIPHGKYKGMRLYLEDLYGSEHILPVEMYYLFQNAFKNNYKVFFLEFSPKHTINIPNEDLIFLNKSIKFGHDDIYLSYHFSNNVLKIKEFQHQDILQFYELAINKNQIGAFFLHPGFKNNFYCFDMFLIVKQDFNLNEILSFNLNLIKINSIIEYDPHTLTLEIMEKKYDVLNTWFKDYIVTFKEISKTRPYNVFELQEKKDLNNLYEQWSLIQENNLIGDLSLIKKDILIAKQKLFDKEDQLMDIKLYIKLFSQKLCKQIFVFDEIITNDTVFFTNFLQLVGGVSVNFENNKININFDELQHYCLTDMYSYDHYRLYTVFHDVYQWKKKY